MEAIVVDGAASTVFRIAPSTSLRADPAKSARVLNFEPIFFRSPEASIPIIGRLT